LAIGPLDVPIGFAVVMTAVTVVYVPYLIWRWPVIWEKPSPVFDQPLAWWVWGEALWRAYVRVLPVGSAVFAVLMVALVPAIYGIGGDAGLVISVAVAVLDLAAWVVLMATIALFNRPRSLVPPHLRQQPGAVAEWRDAWRRRRAGEARSR
jgi:hypothetical protein